ncbi:hypothetical protein EON68_01105, partial [archaeon]
MAALGAAGVYKAAVNNMNAAGVADVEEHTVAVCDLTHALLQVPGIDVRTLGLNKQSLLALKAALRRMHDNATLQRVIPPVVAQLEAIYQEQSGSAFEGALRRLLNAYSASENYVRARKADGTYQYAKAGGGAALAQPPVSFTALTDAALTVDIMSRVLEEESVTPVPADIIPALLSMLEVHAADPCMSSVLMGAVGKLASNADNHVAIVSSRIILTMDRVFKQHRLEEEPRACEGLAAVILPLSFEQSYVRSVLTEASVIPTLIALINRYASRLSCYIGSALPWLPPNQPNHNQEVLSMRADGADAEERNTPLPRLAQMCVQCLANLACDNEEDATGESSVTRILSAGGVEALGALMALHIDKPRLLEDSICALSNMAFVSDVIQLAIGRSCMDTVCTAATRFNADSYLFQMTLRAIGNLTRCDENIMRAVGYGVIRGMVEGMHAHGADPAVLQLCADVIGNMASVDDKKVSQEDGTRILAECSAKRHAAGSAASSGDDALLALLKKTPNLKEAVRTVLYEDGAPRALVDAMTRHFRNADLAGSCLRALHYVGASPDLVTRMVNELSLVEQVVYIMRSIDYRPDVLRRGARVLGLVVGMDSLKDKVLLAGAPGMLLQAIENHKTERELCISCYSVLAMSRSSAVISAVQEMQAVDTAVTILRT